MKSTPKWLMIPPAAALLLLLGPLAMGGADRTVRGSRRSAQRECDTAVPPHKSSRDIPW